MISHSISQNNFLVHPAKSRQFTIIVIYRLPHQSIPKFLLELEHLLTTSTDHTIIIGDLNIPINLETNYTRQFIIFIDSFNFFQNITSPIHITGNTVNLIISHAHSNLTNSHSIKNLFADHHLVFFHIISPRPTRPIINIKYRK